MKKNEEISSIIDFLRKQKQEIDKVITAFKYDKDNAKDISEWVKFSNKVSYYTGVSKTLNFLIITILNEVE